MKRLLLLLLTSIVVSTAHSQEIKGNWNGVLKVQGIQLRLILQIDHTETGYKATLYSPDQSPKGFEASSATFKNRILKVSVPSLMVEYEGTLSNDNMLEGTFRQSGQSFPLNLSQKLVEKTIVVRSQDPKKPYPYYSEDIIFRNEQAGINLAGTLTLPKDAGQHAVVVLISGSGQQNRDEEVFGHKPFLVLADYLTRNGIAVLRFDDRGTAQSEGNASLATSADFATDVQAAVNYLKTRKEINPNKIGLIGHSEGGMIAPMLASRSKDIAFVVLLAAPGQPIKDLMLLQGKMINQSAGVDKKTIEETTQLNIKVFDMIILSTDTEQLKKDLTTFYHQEFPDYMLQGMSKDQFCQAQIAQLTSPWMQYFLKYEPAAILQKVTCPVLALNGSKDIQVSAKENLKAIQQALTKGKNKNVTIKELEGMNHLFQECSTGATSEYASIEQTFSPKALQIISKWINKVTK